MVLQNKYKAKASRRHHSQKASADDAEPGSSKPGFRQRFANKHRQSSSQSGQDGTMIGSHRGEEEGEDDFEDGDDSEEASISGSEEEQANADFPSLTKAAAVSDPSQSSTHLEDPSNPSRGKYARRKLGESKLARLERLEASKDPRLPDEEEPEPEVDISNLVARVAALGGSAGTQAGVAEEIARSRGQHETASDVENDIDHSLAYLHEKERLRQKAKGRGGQQDASSKAHSHSEALDVDADGNAIDLEALQKEKEKAEAVRALKARFQGHGVGERQRPDGRNRIAPSIHIGPQATDSSDNSASSKSGSSEEDTQTASTISDSLNAEIESSLAKTRTGSLNAETASVNSGRSSFSTTFGRRKSPLAHAPMHEPQPEKSSPRAGGRARQTERIDSFLASLNDRSMGGKDPSVFTLNSVSPNPCGPSQRNSNASDRTVKAHPPSHHQPHQQQMPIHSAPGELGRLESFLDDMLG
ncbi:hypothetical protein PSEUBRA_004466 [Kalmanozyma brasiliensis GHG001]|uniref:Uncharacterized protein n=1 Tax=Kalmanozyma brasiliensis (strain GHG001) TaxID=1365824 RepID=V5EU01_KALBG|nr:uncharacterized protein PSEUBRA_004466 [Kalmanozyma brasiliensis GHG001]EST06558.1 hypothetical protein PSEUBRA_004466 [Kalmanozyma brasiliensis GHG001]